MNNQLEISVKNEFVFLNINRPSKGNSLYPDLVTEITKTIEELAHRPTIKGLVLTSSGKNFCTGADLDWVESRDGHDFSVFQKMYEAFYACDLPIVSLVRGKAYGAGMGLAACCDITLCEDTASFCLPETKFGLIPGALTPILVQRIGASLFNYSGILGIPITAQQALSWGVVHEIVSSIQSAKRLSEVLELISEKEPQALRALKQGTRLCQPIQNQNFKALAEMSNQQKNSAATSQKVAQFLKQRKSGKPE